MSKEKKACERCGYYEATDTFNYKNDLGEEKEIEVCRKCNHDLINGGKIWLDPSEAYSEQLERHRGDPLWTPHPDEFIEEED